ncbi:MAG TPA: GNAT family N-acetyltransferase [Geminicoccaceae bacterium]
MALRIERLADHPGLIPDLVAWFIEAWAPWYGPAGPGDARHDLEAACRRDGIPLGLVALEDGRLVGTATLRATSLETHRHLSPWLAAMLVRPDRRRRGIGTRLVAAIEDVARSQGFREVFVATDAAGRIVEGRGWERVERARTPCGQIGIYRRTLAIPTGPALRG